MSWSWHWTQDLILVDLMGPRKGAVVCLNYDTIFKVMTKDWAYDQHEWLSIIISSPQKKVCHMKYSRNVHSKVLSTRCVSKPRTLERTILSIEIDFILLRNLIMLLHVRHLFNEHNN